MTPCRCLDFTLVAVCVGEEYDLRRLIVSVTGANGYPIVDLFDDLDLQEGCFVALTPTVLRSQARFSSEAFALC